MQRFQVVQRQESLVFPRYTEESYIKKIQRSSGKFHDKPRESVQ